MNSLDYWYHCLLIKIQGGYKLPPVNRQDVGTTQIDSANFEHDLREGFPLLTTKKMSLKNIAVELLWFLKGDTNIKYLVDNGCNIWNSDAYKYCLKLYKTAGVEVRDSFDQDSFIRGIRAGVYSAIEGYNYGDLGPVYGKQWRDWTSYEKIEVEDIYGTRQRPIFETNHVDQIANLIEGINEVTKTGVNNRRLIVNAWNVGELEDMALPPCHYGFQVMLEPMSRWDRLKYVVSPNNDEPTMEELDTLGAPKYYLNLKWNQRSVDTFLGLPYNIASYALLAHILGKLTNTIPKMLYGNLSNVHIYDTHIEAVREQLTRKGSDKLPTVSIGETGFPYMQVGLDVYLESLNPSDFKLIGYESDGVIKAEIVT